MSQFQRWSLIIFVFFVFMHSGLGASLRCYNGSMDSYVDVPLDEPLKLQSTTCLDPTRPIVIYTFGYRGKATGPATVAVTTALLNTDKYNVLLLNWEDEAASGILGIPVGYAASAVPNAKIIGMKFGKSILELVDAGLIRNEVYLIGHSLGAHLLGYAGRRTKLGSYTVPRITGLDPSRQLYENAITTENGLSTSCALFVDIVHTDPGGYGIQRAIGSVDFYANYIGKKSTQPGCPEGEFEQFSENDLCSHDRSWRFFSEALGSPTNFLGAYSDTYEAWASGTNNSNLTNYIGPLINKGALGKFYLTTNSASPFGKSEDGVNPNA